jgi:hypothetical protein
MLLGGLRNPISTARAMGSSANGSSFGRNFRSHGTRYAIGAMGGTAGLVKHPGRSSAGAYDPAIMARGGKRVAGVVAAGAAIGGVRNRTTSGLIKGRNKDV